MKSSIGHVVYKTNAAHAAFYKALMAHLGWTLIHDDFGYLGFSDGGGVSIWMAGDAKPVENDYDGPGVNHIGISVPSQVDVDATVAMLPTIGAKPLFETPRHRPDFAMGEGMTYYQVMFESPDKILFEVVYTGPKQ